MEIIDREVLYEWPTHLQCCLRQRSLIDCENNSNPFDHQNHETQFSFRITIKSEALMLFVLIHIFLNHIIYAEKYSRYSDLGFQSFHAQILI